MAIETKILLGKTVADKIKKNMNERITGLRERGIVPKIHIIRVGNKEDDISYEKSIIKNCEKMNISCEVEELSEGISQDELLQSIDKANVDNNIHGILIFRPLPHGLDEDEAAMRINPLKDIDCMSPINLGKIFEGDVSGFSPCTPKAVVEMLEHYEIPIESSNITVIGRSLVVGKPLSMMLLSKNATVTICHSKTKNLEEITKKSDVVVAATGRAKFLDAKYFNNSSIIIDVGVNVDEEGKLCGDVDYDQVFENVEAITPVPRGVGSITTVILMDQAVKACEELNLI